MPSWPSSGAPARSLCRLTDVNRYPRTPHRNVAAAPGIELRLHENLFRASVEVCKVSAACQWHSCKLFQLCRSISAQNPHLWTAAGLCASLWIPWAKLLCTTTYLSHWHQGCLREKLDTHRVWSTALWFKMPLGPPRQIWFCVHLELAFYVTSKKHLQIWPARTTVNLCRLVNLLINIWSKILPVRKMQAVRHIFNQKLHSFFMFPFCLLLQSPNTW